MYATGHLIGMYNGESTRGYQDSDMIQLRLDATTAWNAAGITMRPVVGAWYLTGDRRTTALPIEVGNRIELIEAKVSALCSALSWTIRTNASLDAINTGNVRVNVTALVNPNQLLALDQNDIAYAVDRVKVEITTSKSLSAEKRERLRQIAQRAPFMAMTLHTALVTTTVS